MRSSSSSSSINLLRRMFSCCVCKLLLMRMIVCIDNSSLTCWWFAHQSLIFVHLRWHVASLSSGDRYATLCAILIPCRHEYCFNCYNARSCETNDPCAACGALNLEGDDGTVSEIWRCVLMTNTNRYRYECIASCHSLLSNVKRIIDRHISTGMNPRRSTNIRSRRFSNTMHCIKKQIHHFKNGCVSTQRHQINVQIASTSSMMTTMRCKHHRLNARYPSVTTIMLRCKRHFHSHRHLLHRSICCLWCHQRAGLQWWIQFVRSLRATHVTNSWWTIMICQDDDSFLSFTRSSSLDILMCWLTVS